MPDTERDTPRVAGAAPQPRSAAAPPPPPTVHIDRAAFGEPRGSAFTSEGDSLYGVEPKDGKAL